MINDEGAGRMIRHLTYLALAGFVLAILAGCVSPLCTSTLQQGCDPMPKWRGYSLEIRDGQEK